MAEVLVLGAGVVGLSTAMLLGKDGHHITVVERDPEPPPDAAADEIFQGWQRKGVRQFNQGHYFQPRMREEFDRELPEVITTAEQLGARRFNPIMFSASMTGATWQDGDERFDAVTARRPVMETAFARCAEAADGIDIHRGVAIAGLTTDGEEHGGIPQITGACTEDGRRYPADLVVDVTGRASPLPRWLEAVGGRPPLEEGEDIGFTYYGRHFRGPDLPEQRTPLLSTYETVSTLTLPCDNNTWMVGIIGLSGDAPLRGLLDVDAFTRTLRSFPGAEHWVDGEPVDARVKSMTKMEDRIRRYVVDGRPVATGVVAVGDSWACSNPSLGRGTTIGVLHALALRDAVRATGVDDATALAEAFDTNAKGDPELWLQATFAIDRARKTEIVTNLDGDELTIDPGGDIGRAFTRAAMIDADAFRDFALIANMLELTDSVIAKPGVLDRVIALGADWREHPLPGPTRDELLELIAG